MKTKALKLALEALDYASYNTEPEGDLNCNCLICQATIAVKEALAQPEQEPVAWVVYSSAENDIVWADKGKRLKQNTPLYTTPPQRKPLPKKQIDEMANDGDFAGNVYEITRAIEAAHGIKE